jgi:hypothetical protein
MTTRQELLDQWQQRLAEAEQACEAIAVPAWSDRLRVKLYRFLLAMYGQTDWPGQKDDVDNVQGRSANGQLTVAEPKEVFAGKEPRSRAEILRGLRNVKGLGAELAPAGPLADGLLPDSPVIVASFKKHKAAAVALRKLRRSGFQPAIAKQGHLWLIYVVAANSAAAANALQETSSARRREPAIRTVRQPDRIVSLLSAIFFTVIACLLGSALVHFAFLDWSKVPEARVPLAGELYALAGTTLVFALVASLLFHSWGNSRRSQNSPDCWHDRILCSAIVAGMFGLSLTSYLFLIIFLPFNDLAAKLISAPDAMVWVGTGAFLADLAALALIHFWWTRPRTAEPIIGGAPPARNSR